MTDAELDAAVRRALFPNKESSDRTFRDWLAAGLILAFISTLPLLVWKTIPEGNKETIVYILGQISGMALTVVSFYFVDKVGQQRLEEQRATNSAKAFDAITATANAANTDATPAAVKAADKVADAAVAEADKIAKPTTNPAGEEL